tara:strand:+ start:212 stop:400 length:189 start_codon:yes stop_codon:yes gene_type:complete
MRMNDVTKLSFALEHIAHLEDYINDDWNSSLIQPLNTIKVELEKQEQSLLSNRNYDKITTKR